MDSPPPEVVDKGKGESTTTSNEEGSRSHKRSESRSSHKKRSTSRSKSSSGLHSLKKKSTTEATREKQVENRREEQRGTSKSTKKSNLTRPHSEKGFIRHRGSETSLDLCESSSMLQAATSSAGAVASTIMEESDVKELERVRHLKKTQQLRASGSSSVIFHGYKTQSLAGDVPSIIVACPGYWIECGSSSDPLITPDLEIESTEDQLSPGLWYRAYFLGKSHKNYSALDTPIGPICISVIRERKQGEYIFRTLVRRDTQTVGLCIAESSIKKSLFGGSQFKDILTQIEPLLLKKSFLTSRESKAPSLVDFIGDEPPLSAPRIPRELLYFEQLELIRIYFKFGVLYCTEENRDEEDMFNNNEPSPEFEEFLDFLGDRIQLRGWDKYSAGLDTQSDGSGTHSIFTCYEGKEIMFHVSTLLPYRKQGRVQVERKRHIGNDVIVIIFKEGNLPYVPTTINSPEKRFGSQKGTAKAARTVYRLAVGTQTGVPPFGPPIPAGGLFEKGPAFRDFLFRKLIQGEKAAIRAPRFAERIIHARARVLRHIFETLLLQKK